MILDLTHSNIRKATNLKLGDGIEDSKHIDHKLFKLSKLPLLQMRMIIDNKTCTSWYIIDKFIIFF